MSDPSKIVQIDSLAALIAEAQSLQRERVTHMNAVASIDARLAELKEKIAKAAARNPISTATDGGGRTWKLDGAMVCAPAPTLISEIAEAKLVLKLKRIAGRKFGVLFGVFYRPVKNFRQEAFKQLDRKEAQKLIAAIEKPSTPRVTIAAAT